MSNIFAGVSSWHWLVPDENEAEHGRHVWSCIPESRAAWHVKNRRSHPDVNGGRNLVNYWSIGIELVNSQDGSDSFSDWQVEQAAALVRSAWSRNPQLEHVVSHAMLDPQRRTDPGAGFPWQRFESLVLQSTTTAGISGRIPVRVLNAAGKEIECDARSLDGVTVVEARPLLESLGFRVSYETGSQGRIFRVEERSKLAKRGTTTKRKTQRVRHAQRRRVRRT
jgi:hypothetical protein